MLAGLILPQTFEIPVTQLGLAGVHVNGDTGDPNLVRERSHFERIAAPQHEVGDLPARDAAAP